MLFRSKSYWQEREFSFVLTDASNLDVKDTSPELQHKFCALWNQIVNEVRGSNDRWMVRLILKPIRNVYLALHQDTDSAPIQFSAITGDWNVILREPSSYPVCNIPDHRSDWTPPILPPIYEDDVSMTLARAIPHDPNIPAVVPFFTSPDAPSSSTHAPFPVDETLTNMLPFDNQMSVPVSTSVINQMTTERPHIPSILPGPVTTCAMHGSIDFSRTTEPSTSSPSPKSSASASSLVDIAVGHAELSRAPSGDLNVLSSPSPSTPVLDAIPPTGALLFQVATRSELAFSSPACQSSILASAAEGEGITKAGLSMEEDASYSPLAVREDITATADIPPQLPSPSPVADLVIDDPSGTEHTEHRPIDPAHSQYDIVSH